MSNAQIQQYSAAEDSRAPWRHASQVIGYPLLLWRHRGLVWNFFRRELLGRFRGSFLGIFWVLIQPLFLFALYFLAFGYLFGPKVGPQGPDLSFALFLFGGIIVWNSFVEGTSRSCTVVLDNGNLVKKVKFPSELLPIHLVCVSVMVYLVGAVILLLAGLTTGVMQPDLRLLAWPLVILVHAVFTLGIGLFLAMLQVFMRDTSHLWAIVGQAWFFLSPIFWPPGFLEDRLGPAAARIAMFNPAYPLIQMHRQVLGLGELRVFGNAAFPGYRAVIEPFWSNLGMAALWGAVFLVIGYTMFMAKRHKFADLV